VERYFNFVYKGQPSRVIQSFVIYIMPGQRHRYITITSLKALGRSAVCSRTGRHTYTVSRAHGGKQTESGLSGLR